LDTDTHAHHVSVAFINDKPAELDHVIGKMVTADSNMDIRTTTLEECGCVGWNTGLDKVKEARKRSGS